MIFSSAISGLLATSPFRYMLTIFSGPEPKNLGGGTFPAPPNVNGFIAKFSSAGAHVWSKRFGAVGDDFVDAVAVDVSDNVVLGGGLSNVRALYDRVVPA